jgi:hypothetical protein
LQLETSPASNNSPDYEHVKALGQDAKHANINTITVKTSEAQLSHLSFAFRIHEWFNPLNAELNPICHSLILLGDLTFMVTCIVSIFQYISNKMQR